ncbi:class II fructose-1,6-bisphosphate aldolase [Muricomes intestini]|uniref:class II fructose-1,6-bisphosphate aldolase n=3 Tax=Muricomes intestini TaxID=1796634 RepID=UPI002FE0FF18
MLIRSTKEMLEKAKAGRYAVAAFNAENMEMVQAIVEAAEELKAPVIIQTTSGTLKYATPELYYSMAAAAAQKSEIPVAIHLDHGDSYERAAECLHAGYSSIMIDGSKEPFEKNVEITKEVVKMAHAMHIPVEGELGTVGGKEDSHSVINKTYTEPAEAEEFVKRTHVDSLAVGIGNSHGFYKGKPELRFDILEETNKWVTIPVVLHGASGIPEEDVKKAIEIGIAKVNFATELRDAFSKAVKNYFQKDIDVIDPKKYCSEGRTAVKQLAMRKIEMCGSAGKAVKEEFN